MAAGRDDFGEVNMGAMLVQVWWRLVGGWLDGWDGEDNAFVRSREVWDGVVHASARDGF